ncbi:BMS1 [Candida oxycetoniae]|uniref:BMS1 n=1 Tax=Candida oxycetoniae TaxID=497107 RepID=A0AAI9SWE7_9ASCO|nr:BMS1 [Candida oxycetoniae]KAI3403966.2 BMS1 [Candida oxycetoniae]
MDQQQSNKAHRGATKKTGAKKKLHQNGNNAKAFAVSAPRKLERMARRSHDVNERKLHVPMVDRTPEDDPPPVIVAVVGPPGTGKSTLIKSLIRRLTKTTLTEIKGPITVVSGKRRRLTFIEVNNDLNSMIDMAKVADLVLMLIDGNYGLEMETMEFLNIAQHHGMPRVLGVATHLDLFKSQSTLRTSKKRLKHRFWTEVYQGAKLFYLSGVINGRYPDREILNLSRFISVMKFRPLKWRNEHPYLLGDRITDLTHPQLIAENPRCDRKVAVYGYLHGTPLPSTDAHIHIAGVGDYTVSAVEKLPDPCPTPYFEQKIEELERERIKAAAESGEPLAKTTRRRKRLEDKQKIIYAPMSDVGGVLVDKDAVYIDIGNKESFNAATNAEDEFKGEGETMVTNLQSVVKTMSERFEEGPGLQLFSNSNALKTLNGNEEGEEEEEEEEGLLSGDEEEVIVSTGRKTLRNARVYGKSIAEDDEFDDMEFSDEEEEDVSDGENGESSSRLVEIDFDENDSKNQKEFEYVEDSALSSDDDDNDDEDRSISYKATAAKLRGSSQKWNINKLIYMTNIDPADALRRWRGESLNEEVEEDIEQDDEDFFKKKDTKDTSADLDNLKPTFPSLQELKKRFNENEDSDEEYENGYEVLKKRLFSAPKLNNNNNNDDDNDDDDEGNTKNVGEDEDNDEEIYGDFEDLEEENQGDNSKEEDLESGNKLNEDEDDFADFEAEENRENNETEEEEEEEEDMTLEERRRLNAEKKAQFKTQFEEEEDREFGADDPEGDTEAETWYEFQKNKMAKQLEINKAQYEEMDEQQRIKIEGYKAGSYVKIVFDSLPCEFVETFAPEYPLVLGGLLATESRFGIMNTRIRRHRWYKKILKSQDPLILSLGWRRFQTLPIYTTSDSRARNRMLKYTPEHAYCFASFYGPLVAPNTTFVGFNMVDNESTTGAFRVAATGIVEDINSSVEIVKKLKLVGYPYKIYRNTAFVKDMFSNALEVAKFEGAQIRTVSGIRGEIKRALSKPDGCFRATFEDKVLMSDTIFLKTWYPIKIKKFYNPVTSLLLSRHSDWKGMRLTGQVRAENNILTPLQDDSQYKKIERVERRFNPLRVPKSIKSELPFKSQIHEMKPQKKQTYMSKRAVVLGGEEKKARDLMQKISTIRKEKDTKRKAKKVEKFKDKLKKIAKIEEFRKEKESERKKDYFAKEGKKRKLNSGGDGANKKRR